jgi:hypothetical protein
VLDVPLAFIASFTYDLPFGAGKPLRTGSNFADKHVIGGWKTSGVVTLQNGTPLGISTELTLAAIGAVRANVAAGSQLCGQHDRSTFDPAADLYLYKAAIRDHGTREVYIAAGVIQFAE